MCAFAVSKLTLDTTIYFLVNKVRRYSWARRKQKIETSMFLTTIWHNINCFAIYII